MDFVTSTNTLEHIPEPDVRLVLAECRRLLRPGGALSCRIDLRDHYSYFDRSLSHYNFLRYSRHAWRLANSPLMHQNRLRYPDYLDAFTDAGFELMVVRAAKPRPRQLERLKGLRIAPEQQRYSLEELGAPSLRLVARPAPEAGLTTRCEGARRSPRATPPVG